jgi:hypothetical protein
LFVGFAGCQQKEQSMIVPDTIPVPVMLFVFFVLAFWATKEYGAWGLLAAAGVLWLMVLNYPNS